MNFKKLKLEDVFGIVLGRLIDIGKIKNSDPVYRIIKPSDDATFYESIVINDDLTLPSEDLLNEAFELYKSELIALDNQKKAEQARVDTMLEKWNSIKDKRGAISELGLKEPNPKIFLKRLIKQDMQSVLDDLVTASSSFDVKVEKKERSVNYAKGGSKIRTKCNSAVDIYNGYIDGNKIKKTEQTALNSTFKKSLDALRLLDKAKAKTQLNKIELGQSEHADNILELMLDEIR